MHPEPDTPTTRRADLSDLDVVVPLFDAYRQFYAQAADCERARQFLHDRLGVGEAVLLVAELDAAVVGFTLLYPGFSSVATARTFVLNDLFVEPAARRRGAGLALLAAVVEYARAAGAFGISLETARSNHAAQALYRRAGWTADATQWFHLPLN